MSAPGRTTLVLAAAGAGERLGADRPKALVELAGRPLLAWSLRAFVAAPSVGAAVIAAPPGHEDEIAAAAAEAVGDRLALEVVPGAARRADSVAAALAAVATDLVAIHDAARPLVTAELIEALVARLVVRDDADAVIAAAPVTDTIKRARRGAGPSGELAVAATEPRELLWAAQTPQAFRAERLRAARRAAGAAAAEATDEAVLVERAGGLVLIEPAPASNLKVTTPVDLELAALLLG